MDVLESLVEKGTVERGYLGIVPENLSQDIKKALNYPHKTGVYIKRVEEKTPADEAGLAEGDIILKIENKKIENVNALRKEVSSKNPNEKIKVTVWRNGVEKILTVKLGKRPSAEISTTEPAGEVWLGMQLLPSTSKEAQNIWGEQEIIGVFVNKIEPGSPAYKSGVVENSLITLVQSKNQSIKIKNLEDIIRAQKEFQTPLVLLTHLSDGSIRVISIEGS